VASGSLGTISVTAFSGGDNPTSELVPGGSSDLIVRIDNTNAYAVTLTAISLNGSITVSGSLGEHQLPVLTFDQCGRFELPAHPPLRRYLHEHVSP
jgi:hypothetical protein